MLLAEADLQTMAGEKESCTHSSVTFRLKVLDGRKCRKIDCVIECDPRIEADTAAQHKPVITSRPDRIDQRVCLGVANPVGVEPFIEDVEGSEETSCGKGDVFISDVIELGVFERLLDGARKISGIAIASDEVAFEF